MGVEVEFWDHFSPFQGVPSRNVAVSDCGVDVGGIVDVERSDSPYLPRFVV